MCDTGLASVMKTTCSIWQARWLERAGVNLWARNNQSILVSWRVMSILSTWLQKRILKCQLTSLVANHCQFYCVNTNLSTIIAASVAQLDAPSDWRPGGRGFNPRRGRQHSFVEIDHEIFSTVILSLPLIEEGQLSVSGERMCTILVNRLED